MKREINLEITIPDSFSGQRADRALAQLLPDYSRSRIKSWLLSGELTVEGSTISPKQPVKGGEQVVLQAHLAIETAWQAQAIALDICYEDDALLILNKPPKLVVHPAAGHHDGTLANALLHHAPQLEQLPRAGLIHRLDRDTSGLLVVAKTLESYHHLVNQMKNREISRQYEAIVQGELTGGGTVDAPIGRHPRQRTRMAVVANGKAAVTHYRLIERLGSYTRVKIILESGRTHQIRVHMRHIGHPIFGDPLYGGRLKLPKGADEQTIEFMRHFKRQALHAGKLALAHPTSHERMEFKAGLPNDIKQLIAYLRKQ
ncbi:MAG: 23S rRNA pseudouridine(1911/1915/1917) synthase RluD [Gammaproteobacteria bacterium]|nr:23S rRNA pseudouridine(1911/1915/1917) synthase RluD [Gammaproteobacteria bacterium]